MRELFRHPGGGAPRELDHTTTVDPRIERDPRHHWTLQSALWRARLLADAVFGASCCCDVGAFPRTVAFQGMLELEVPFVDPEQHFRRERLFRSWASRDPVLGQVSLLFVFRPRLVERLKGISLPQATAEV